MCNECTWVTTVTWSLSLCANETPPAQLVGSPFQLAPWPQSAEPWNAPGHFSRAFLTSLHCKAFVHIKPSAPPVSPSLQPEVAHKFWLPHISTSFNILQHPSTSFNILQLQQMSFTTRIPSSLMSFKYWRSAWMTYCCQASEAWPFWIGHGSSPSSAESWDIVGVFGERGESLNIDLG